MHTPSDFQQKVFNIMAMLGLSQVQIQRDRRTGRFTLHTSSCAQRLAYFVLRVNTISKLLFLVLLSCGVFQSEFEFFEKMAILLWFLIFVLLAISEKLFYRKYPFFELLTSWWVLNHSVYTRLGKPKKFLADVKWIGVWRVWFQGIIALVGVLAVIVQYDAAPKYCVFAYSLVPFEDVLVKWIFGIHEVLFLCHAWIVYGSVIYVSSVIGAEFTYTLDSLQHVMDMFILQHGGRQRSLNTTLDLTTKSLSIINHKKSTMIGSGSGRINYTPRTLVQEYCHVHMVVNELNNIAAYNFLFMHGCSYVQMVSDVFQMIQILRGPDADFMAVVFFCEDMMVCMYMLFRCFKSMAFVQPSSLLFLQKFNDLMACSRFSGGGHPITTTNTNATATTTTSTSRSDRAVLMKTKRCLRTVAFKLGPCTVGPWTVGMAMDVLLQYYICVALW